MKIISIIVDRISGAEIVAIKCPPLLYSARVRVRHAHNSSKLVVHNRRPGITEDTKKHRVKFFFAKKDIENRLELRFFLNKNDVDLPQETVNLISEGWKETTSTLVFPKTIQRSFA